MAVRLTIGLCCAGVLLAIQGSLFEEIPGSAGIDFRHENSPTAAKYLLETMGGGVALFDFDNDGDLDIFFTGISKRWATARGLMASLETSTYG